MATAMPPETLNPDTSHIETLVVQGTEEAELRMDESQATLTEEQIGNISQPRTSSIWKKSVHYVDYWAMLFSGFAVIISGMTSRHENGWGLAFIV
jgi:hypothetical protein